MAHIYKFEQIAACGVTGFLTAMDLSKSFCVGRTSARAIGITFIITARFGALIEICQAVIPCKSAWFSDAAGSAGAPASEKLFNKKGKDA